MAQVGARPTGADAAVARRVERPGVGGEAGVAQVQPAGVGEQRPVPGQAGGQHAVEHVDAERHGLDEAARIADPHQVARPVGRQHLEGRSQRRQHLVAGLPHRQPADAVAVEVEGDGPLGALPAQALVDAALHDAEQRLAAAVEPAGRVGGPGARRPPGRAVDRVAHHRLGGRQGRAHVEDHLDVGAEQLLDADRRLRREGVPRAVVGGREGGALLGDLRPEGEDLVTARVGQHVAVPGGEAVQATELADQLGPGAQHQVVRVRQHHLGPERLEVIGSQRAHRGPGADGHEARRLERAPRRADPAPAGRAVGGVDLDADHRLPRRGRADVGRRRHAATSARSTSMASPKERNR